MLADQKLLAGDIDGGLADYAALVNDRSRGADPHTRIAAEPVPDDLAQALTKINSPTSAH